MTNPILRMIRALAAFIRPPATSTPLHVLLDQVALAREDFLADQPAPFTLAFTPGAGLPRFFKRQHPTFQAAFDEAHRVIAHLADPAATPATIVGPYCGAHGWRVG